MDLIESGMDKIRGGADGCPCICSRATGGFRASDIRGLEKNICGCNCSINCSPIVLIANNADANATMADNYN
jgi:hypothetical protein